MRRRLIGVPRGSTNSSTPVRKLLFATILLCSLIGICSGDALPAANDINNDNFDLQKCTVGLNNGKITDFNSLNMASDLCYKNSYNQVLLRDFIIRRQRYTDQSYLDVVLLWMVVILTFSGVALSALQILISYRISKSGNAALPDTSEMSIERGKLTLRSSIVGLFTLALSLIFFIIYVYGVYTIKEGSSDSLSSLHGVTGGVLDGGLGAPPGSAEPTTANTPLRSIDK